MKPNVYDSTLSKPKKVGDPPANHNSSPGNTYARGVGYRGDLRTDPIRDNAATHSKGTKRYGDQGSKIDSTHGSTGESPGKLPHDTGRASLPARDKTNFGSAPEPTKVGFHGGKHVPPSYGAASEKIQAIDRASTRASKGMAASKA